MKTQITPEIVFGVIAGYFLVLIIIAYFTSKKANVQSFFNANKNSPWYLVAFGMIGASLSGVTFISVPGEVGNTGFEYFQIVIGYMLGYFIIANVLLPLYYKLNLVSIYSYLQSRFGIYTYKTGSVFFIISQTIGASFRLFLVAMVLQLGFFDAFHIPFVVTVLTTIILIWIYTYRAGIKTIVWTDTIQTVFMLLSVILSIVIISDHLNLKGFGIIETIHKSDLSNIFNWEWRSEGFFVKQFFAGAFIAIVMTGLDQNMMQKNLTCRNIKDAKKNMYWFSGSLIFVNLLFLGLGVLLYIYANSVGFSLSINEQTGLYQHTDKLFPMLAINHFSIIPAVIFLIGITAAAFSSADSALTALTTSFCYDFLDIERFEERKRKRFKNLTHIGFSILMLLVIVLFKAINNDSVINHIFTFAGYTYGPLLGFYSFGLFTKMRPRDKYVPLVAILSPILTFVLDINSEFLFGGYKMGFELLIINGIITFFGLLLLSLNNKA